MKNRLAEAKKRVQELEKLICRIYEDNILGKRQMNDIRFLTDSILKNRKICRQKLQIWKLNYQAMKKVADQRRSLLLWLINTKILMKLTTYMLNEFVEKIVVHERDRKGSIETTQEVEIYFNFIENIYRHISVRWK